MKRHLLAFAFAVALLPSLTTSTEPGLKTPATPSSVEPSLPSAQQPRRVVSDIVPGRFQLVQRGEGAETMRIDTATGETWVLRTVYGQARSVWFPIGEWEPGMKSDFDHLLQSAVDQMKQLEVAGRLDELQKLRESYFGKKSDGK